MYAIIRGVVNRSDAQELKADLRRVNLKLGSSRKLPRMMMIGLMMMSIWYADARRTERRNAIWKWF